jgi:hypothetical protein
MTVICRITGCRRKPHARGLCQRHYDQQRKTAARAALPREARRGASSAGPRAGKPAAEAAGAALAVSDASAALAGKLCCVPGCTNPHHAKGYCKSHYGQLRRRGRIESLSESPGGKPPLLSREQRLVEIMKRHELLKKEIANIHKELESEVDDD